MEEVKEESVQKKASRFEERVRRLLHKMGFKDVNGGTTFKIGGMQIDACGGHENTLLVIECYAPIKNRTSIRQKITEFKGSKRCWNASIYGFC